MATDRTKIQGVRTPLSKHPSSRKSCDRCFQKKTKCSAPFGKDSPCRSCRKNGADCVFSDRQKTGPKAKGAKGVSSSPGVSSATQGARVGRTVEEPMRAASGRARSSTTETSGHEAETTTAACALDASEGLASRWTTAYWRFAVDANNSNSDAAQTSVAGVKANNGNRQKELRADMHAIGDRLTVSWTKTAVARLKQESVGPTNSPSGTLWKAYQLRNMDGEPIQQEPASLGKRFAVVRQVELWWELLVAEADSLRLHAFAIAASAEAPH
ncbi:fungal zinc cluster transcription factor, putative [Ectocarpus siliculosus]|uniref:Fungal zinc cluster transcription factor, putative n=1 Tax=Ectocarpus siliculosus TaxID=2880 RepID=D7G8B8_ECTSI|nr:fungal zinc cluster transcription factor, putative [Ectocarpus siliculosus]|eukprot:CBJ27970.1 fungal zinc cluster transcription factor, putative [Ectocarpus siliculosus]